MVRASFVLSALVAVGGVFAACGSEPEQLPSANAGSSGTGDGSGAVGGSAQGGAGGDGGTGASAGESGSSSGGTNSGGSSAGGSGGSGGTSSGGSNAGGTGPVDASYPDVQFVYDAGPGDDGGVGDACASGSADAKPLPLDMYIILDKSGSMHEPQCTPGLFSNGCGDCNVGDNVNSRWCKSINALYGFFSAPTSVGMGVALQYFSGSNCGALSNPAVALNILPAHLTQLRNSLNGINPSGGTPTMSAAQGIVQFTGANQTAGRKMIGILITDGDPTSCGDETQINTALKNHFNATGIPTFVIGMDGATFSRLETMANGAGAQSHTNYCGGGITPCHFYNVGAGDSQAFIDALQAIQQSAVGCGLAMPTSTTGIIDVTRVEVQYTPTTGPVETYGRVSDANACASSDGFYYDNNTKPTNITLCPTSCNKVTSDQGAKLEVLLGCLGS